MTVDSVDVELAQPVLAEAIQLFENGEVDEVFVTYTRFISTVKQDTIVEKLLPLASTVSKVPDGRTFEPRAEVILELVTRRYVEAKLTQCILESLASEHASRMLAMKNATDNASD